MKKYLYLIFIISLYHSSASASENKPTLTYSSKPVKKVISGKGWGGVIIGATKEKINSEIGEFEIIHKNENIYVALYNDIGAELIFYVKDNTVRNMYFYRKGADNVFYIYNGKTFKGKTDKKIDLNNSVNDVIDAYGKPLKHHKGKSWQRIIYDGIDFKFQNNRMVRIGIQKSNNK